MRRSRPRGVRHKRELRALPGGVPDHFLRGWRGLQMMEIGYLAGVPFLLFRQLGFRGSRCNRPEAFRTDRIDRAVRVTATRETCLHARHFRKRNMGNVLPECLLSMKSERDTGQKSLSLVLNAALPHSVVSRKIVSFVTLLRRRFGSKTAP
jgi:hypothetical protein